MGYSTARIDIEDALKIIKKEGWFRVSASTELLLAGILKLGKKKNCIAEIKEDGKVIWIKNNKEQFVEFEYKGIKL